MRRPGLAAPAAVAAAALVFAGCGSAPAAPGDAEVTAAVVPAPGAPASAESTPPGAETAAPPPVTVVGGPSAQEVVDYLAIPGPRDTTAAVCPQAGCTQAVATDVLSVLRFDDPDAQQRYVAGFGDYQRMQGAVLLEFAHADGPIVLQYATGRTDLGQRGAYQEQLRAFLDAWTRGALDELPTRASASPPRPPPPIRSECAPPC